MRLLLEINTEYVECGNKITDTLPILNYISMKDCTCSSIYEAVLESVYREKIV
jgi:hypothetical protein